MSKYLPKAERMFQQKLKRALAPDWAIHDFLTGDDIQALPKDEITEFEFKMFYRDFSDTRFPFNYIAELFQQYGNYLLLIEDDNDVPAEADTGTG